MTDRPPCISLEVLAAKHEAFVLLSTSTSTALEKRMDERFEAYTEKLKLQSMTYDRRLDELNHVYEQVREQRANFIGREAFDFAIREQREKVETVTRYMNWAIGGLAVFQLVVMIVISVWTKFT